MLAAARTTATRPAAGASRARVVQVNAVAQPKHKRAAGKAPQASSSSGAASKASGASKEESRKARAAAYSTWQAMAKHASTSSATPSGFDESMM
ncbi:hypothetical protein MNEG_4527 [Monoraphidium neglectum]|uniref:Uncharacterized protein n=1 Tax=Monoraphidium neglectum TaxID=145388 RepID=A0A0D2L9A6_9CHLO|nr:hypothetical protein MNEG_4527 [Monoraphidium neglectum]KIZ03429.1 hypothetical protein MNEG_4527 [Monoraphidium neglectum]|eukprot:XP_013902448.1 hypothetical protein MNEG_4527 [Monoraphidium neglectum]